MHPVHFVHAADLHLERPFVGLPEVPEHLRDLLAGAAYRAAAGVFDAACDAEFLLLSGDILQLSRSGPRGIAFLAEQFERLAQRNVPVYWAGSKADEIDEWPGSLRWPANVHVFSGPVAQFNFERRGQTAVQVTGASGRKGKFRVADYRGQDENVFTVAVAHRKGDAASFEQPGVDYWALGGQHSRETMATSPGVVHYAGTPQGRSVDEDGPHGCTVVEIDQGRANLTFKPTDVVRWRSEKVAIDEKTDRQDLERTLQQRLQAAIAAAAGRSLLIAWRVVGTGTLVRDLRSGLAADLLSWLRSQYGYGSPAAWSVSFDVTPPPLRDVWFEQETILGDFMRTVRRYREDPALALDVRAFLPAGELADKLAEAAQFSEPHLRERILEQVAALGADLLSGEEPR